MRTTVNIADDLLAEAKVLAARTNRLCRETGPTANLVSDAYHAALAIEDGAVWITNDRGFAWFPRLIWRSPLD